ncbi:unnamed protein product [Dibothriocephalus latus]|uniref:Uncharacterized protein n=1 Tax=Dibothriocephalus latus TaxID=60516 RepID=A0A3P6U8Q6_DIBLA|nr:unnamed protein product [Dibothriocephalus latus]
MCGQRRPVFTQETGPFIFTTALPGAPWYVILNHKTYTVDTEKGICNANYSNETFKCNVERYPEFSRITIFIAEIKSISRILIGARSSDEPDRFYWISVEFTLLASSETQEEEEYSVLKFEVKPGEKKIAIYTCISEDSKHLDLVSYRYFWPDVQEKIGTFTFTYKYERFGNIEQSAFVCNLAAESQTHTVYWRGKYSSKLIHSVSY